MRRHRITEEEKAAKKIAELVCDLRLDIEQVGIYLAQLTPFVAYNRIQEVAEAAKFYKEEQYNDHRNQYTLF
jgi:hypothetical protein